MFLAIGMATWKSSDGGTNPKAPAFLIPVSVTEQARHVILNRTGDLVVNRIMLQAWEEDHKHKPTLFDNDDLMEIGILNALDQLAAAGSSLEGFSVAPECYLGNFSFAKMAMVEDLKRNEALLLLNRLVCAIAGDPASIDSIKEDAGIVEREELDEIDPFNEIVVLEADEYQRQAIHSLVRFKADGVIDGPPGTGKSQTIANLIAALVAEGKRVLFVAEKRAALDAVFNRLSEAGLQDIVLDLHGADARRKVVYDRLRYRDDRARIAEGTPSAAPVKNLKQLRAKLNAYYYAVNRQMDGCGLSVREIVSRLGKLSPQAVAQTIWYDGLSEWTPDLHDEALESVKALAAHPDLFRRTPDVAWSNAEFITHEDAAKAIRFVAESRSEILGLRQSLEPFGRASGRKIATVADLAWACDSIRELGAIREILADSIVMIDAEQLLQRLQPLKKGSIPRLWSFLSDASYRAARKAILSCSRSADTKIAYLAAALERFATLPDELRSRQAFVIVTPSYVENIKDQWCKVKDIGSALAKIAGETLPQELDAMGDRLTRLGNAHRDARRIHEIRAAEKRLYESHYHDLSEELKRTSVASELWHEMVDYAWLRSCLEKAKADEPVLGTFSRESFEKMRAAISGFGRKTDRSIAHYGPPRSL